MIERISKKYAMTEKGAKDYVLAVFWSVLVNISKMLPVGVLATTLSGIVEALTNGTDPRAGLMRFLVAGVLALAALFVTFLIQYKALYEATYRESANRRIRLAEVLRQLPLSFFGNRDLTDLTTTIMGDTETLEKAFSHFYPAMHGALISTALISAGMLLYDWRMALALLWVVPASLLMVYLSRRMEKRHIKKGLVTRRAATDAMQEVLECAPEIKACNQKTRYIADLNRRLDEAEQDTIRGELFTGSVVTAAQSFLKLGIATTVLAGVTLMSRGDEVFHHSSAEFFHIGLGVAIAAHAVVAQGSVAFVPQFFAHGVPQVDHLVVNGVELLLMLLIPGTLGFPGGQAAGIVGVVFEGRELA